MEIKEIGTVLKLVHRQGVTVYHEFLWHRGGTKIKENKNALTVFNHKGLIFLWSGKRDLNPQPSAWEADTLPLSYSRKSGAGDGI